MCGVILDVQMEALFARVLCPSCHAEVRVRQRVGSYLLVDVLGQGGSSSVFRARKEGADGDVALKVLEKNHSDYEENVQLLRNEAHLATLAAHPRVVKVHALVENDEGALLEMELMHGGSLHDKIVSEGRLSEQSVLMIGLQILKALASAQKVGITHGDLKPANILLTAEGGAKLGDFGLAHGRATKKMADSHLLATPDYVSPEVLGGSHGNLQSDLYSLGGCLFHALAGVPPYKTEGLSTAELQRLKARAILLPQKVCSNETRSLVARMMALDPARRFHSCEKIEEAFLSVLKTLDSESKNPGSKRGGSSLGGALRQWKGSW